jgi:dynein heavy chain
MELTEKRLERAQKLIVLTADEAIRWKETVEKLNVEIENCFGNTFLASS